MKFSKIHDNVFVDYKLITEELIKIFLSITDAFVINFYDIQL